MSLISKITNVTSTVGNIIKKSFGPLEALNPAKKEIWQLRYPLDVGDANLYPHTMELYMWKPETVEIDELKDVSSEGSSGLALLPNPTNDPKIAYLNEVAGARKGATVNLNRSKNDRLLDFNRRSSLTDIITLYLPGGGLQDIFTNSYNQESMTEALGKLGFAADAAASLIKEWNNSQGSFMDKLWGAAETSKPMVLEGAAQAGLISGTARDAGMQALGYALNPQFEVLYKGTNMRGFTFTFNLTPRSKDEAREIKEIITRLRYHASPEYIKNQGRYFIPPSYVDIELKYRNAPNGNLPFKISTCVIEGIDVSFAQSDDFTSYEDGSPTQYNLTLHLREIEVMHKALREEGY